MTEPARSIGCNVCGSTLPEPIFDSACDVALTSLCELRSGRKRVWSCAACAHLRGDVLDDTAAYYESGYRILLDHDDEDQIYEMRDGRIVYRTEHQVDVLLRKLSLPPAARLLDYGCAKASTPRRLLEQRPDLLVHLYDVSEMYTAHWGRFVPQERRAVHRVRPGWEGSFDVLTSFFALEHIPQPREAVARIADLLKDDGLFYAIVPDTFGNVADFVVIDHVNHFTVPSLHRLLREAGFGHIEIDAQAHRGALVVVARKSGPPTPPPAVEPVLAQARELAAYWSALAGRIRTAEAASEAADAAIYGSGFYGAYIASTLTRPQQLCCFLDRSPFQQGKSLMGKPILAPQALPARVRTLYVGLNPQIARATMAQLDWLPERDVDLVFLDEAAP